jgi:hypothetical protein
MMKRLSVVLLLACFALPLALASGARMPGVRRQRDDGDRDRGDRDRREAGVLVITRAIYGSGKQRHNITAALNADVHDGRLRLPVNNDTMGGDPAKNKPKTLTVSYTFDGRPYQVMINENDFLDLPRPGDFRR